MCVWMRAVKLLHSRTRAYLAKDGAEADFTIDLSEEFFARKHEQYPQAHT